jgi:UPF0755 protein
MTNSRRLRIAAAVLVLVLAGAAWATTRPGDPVRVVIPAGATLSDVADSLSAKDVIGSSTLFKAYARLRRAERRLKSGTYEMETGSSYRSALRRVTRGEMVTVPLTIPEGFRLDQMAGRIARIAGVPVERVAAELESEELGAELDLPGPGLEGYLFPDTYRFAQGVPLSIVIEAMAARYRRVWTPERRARLDALGMTEQELVTLASIVQAEARRVDEMPRIAGVYHNRLNQGWFLQADPTVLYALGGYRERLLYAAIDSVEDSPYNTYARAGLPPGPIGSPGERAIDAALSPEDHDFMYFVAWPDGTHVFTRSLAEHNAARANAVRAREAGRSGS